MVIPRREQISPGVSPAARRSAMRLSAGVSPRAVHAASVARGATSRMTATAEFTGELGHIPGAVNIPLGGLSARTVADNLMEAGHLVLVCKTHMRSAKAADLLVAAGFRDVAVLRGGMVDWSQRQHTHGAM
jgi:3-mercaptopyruvate sulfurtransferase SseA